MKRKAQRVPQFSSVKRPVAGTQKAAPQQNEKPAPVASRAVVKPQSTSSKSGRRGQ